jgi:hypothetical protein
MDILKQIIDLIMGLLGQKSGDDKPALSTSATSAPSSADPVSEPDDDDDDDDEDDDDLEMVIERRDGAALVEDPDDGERMWVNQVDGDVPRDAWNDVWGPLDGPDDGSLANFFHHETVFNMEQQSDPAAAEGKLQAFGYADVGEFFKVRMTIVKHFGTPDGPNVGDAVMNSQRVMSASMKGASLMHQQTMADTTAADPGLVEPIHGVTIEDYAVMSAQAGSGDWQALLASKGLDQARWDEVASGWTDRMANDTTHTLTMKYGSAFQSAGVGQFGAAGAAHAATGHDGTAAGGEEPMPFDKACEIQGATSAWSNTGQDVNALLQQTFGMNAQEWAAANSWWMSQLTADVARFEDYNARVEKYEKQYSAGAPAAPDDDLDF